MVGVVKYQLLMKKEQYSVKVDTEEWTYSDRELVEGVFNAINGLKKTNLSVIQDFEDMELVCVCAETLFEFCPSIQLYNLVCRVLSTS